MDFAIPVTMLLVFNILCGCFAGGVATTKGRESIVWFFGGFLAGPIALIAIAGMPTSLEEAETKAWLAERRKEQEEAKRQRRARGRT